MAVKERSPNYPSVGLETAIASAGQLYRKEKRSPVPMEVAAKDLGYQSLSGPARSRLAAMRHYGLIDLTGKALVKVSDRAMVLLFREPTETQYREELQKAALEPAIFRDLYDGYRDASESNIRWYLMGQRKYSEDGAQRLIRSFQATLDFAKLTDQSYDPDDRGDDEENTQDSPDDGLGWDDGRADGSVDDPKGRHGTPRRDVPMQTYSWPLTAGLTAEIKLTGTVTPQAIDMLKKYLELYRDALLIEPEEARPTHVAGMSVSDDEQNGC
jgi:hypothetical protein